MYFDSPTSRPPVSNADEIQQLFKLSSKIDELDVKTPVHIGSKYTGFWPRENLLVITIVDASMPSETCRQAGNDLYYGWTTAKKVCELRICLVLTLTH